MHLMEGRGPLLGRESGLQLEREVTPSLGTLGTLVWGLLPKWSFPSLPAPRWLPSWAGDCCEELAPSPR